ncbi:MAG: LysM peptidoglycan-binding domain-containing protein [Clostridiales bacterium]|nr:LysM peptidoglycan-binding domain-containing protein [Clostridiales bacterium]
MANRKRKSYRIKSKFRFTTSITIMLILFIFMANTVLGLDYASSLTKHEPVQIEIQSGDSLWNIARQYGPNHMDTRKIVYDICNLNNISADSIYPGQQILIPDYSS